MNFVRLLPVVFTFLLLAAHFSRADLNILALMSFLPLVLLFFKKPWVPLVIRLLIVVAVLEWVRALVVYIMQREAAGEPWMRLLYILGGVIIFNLLSMLVFRNKKLKSYFGLE